MRHWRELEWYVRAGFGDPLGAGSVSRTPLIINAAITGGVLREKDSPFLPVTPGAIVADAERCFRAGARVLHLHARAETGEPAWEPQHYERIIPEIRSRCDGVVVCATTTGRTFRTFETRAAALFLDGPSKPDAASLTPGSMNFPTQASVTDPPMVRRLARALADRGIAAELEVFEAGMINFCSYLEAKGILRRPLYFNLLLGSLGTIPAGVRDLEYLVESLPSGSVWAATGIGRFQFPVNVAAIARGGHVRVGLEDSLFLDAGRTELATNEGLVERIVEVGAALGRPVATPAEARCLLGLRTAPETASAESARSGHPEASPPRAPSARVIRKTGRDIEENRWGNAGDLPSVSSE